MPDECQGCGVHTRHLTPTDYGEVCDACAVGLPPVLDDDGELVA